MWPVKNTPLPTPPCTGPGSAAPCPLLPSEHGGDTEGGDVILPRRGYKPQAAVGRKGRGTLGPRGLLGATISGQTPCHMERINVSFLKSVVVQEKQLHPPHPLGDCGPCMEEPFLAVTTREGPTSVGESQPGVPLPLLCCTEQPPPHLASHPYCPHVPSFGKPWLKCLLTAFCDTKSSLMDREFSRVGRPQSRNRKPSGPQNPQTSASLCKAVLFLSLSTEALCVSVRTQLDAPFLHFLTLRVLNSSQ